MKTPLTVKNQCSSLFKKFYLHILEKAPKTASIHANMINPIVIPQIALLPEAEPAFRTNERLLVGMDEPVPLQLVLDPEAPAAHIARVRLLPGVPRDVDHQRGLRPEALAAVAALERERVRVRPVVDEERRLLLERLAAQVADVRPLVRVDPPVLDDVAPRREHPAADVALEVLDALVGLLQVPDQALGDAELLPAEVADEGALASVDAHVPDVGVGGMEALAADLAVVVDPAIHYDLGGVHFLLVDLRLSLPLLFAVLLGGDRLFRAFLFHLVDYLRFETETTLLLFVLYHPLFIFLELHFLFAGNLDLLL